MATIFKLFSFFQNHGNPRLNFGKPLLTNLYSVDVIQWPIRELPYDVAGLRAVALPVSLKEVGVAGGLPPDGRVHPVIGDVPAIIHQLLRVAGLQVGLPEQPEPVPCERERGGGGAREEEPSCDCTRYKGTCTRYMVANNPTIYATYAEALKLC